MTKRVQLRVNVECEVQWADELQGTVNIATYIKKVESDCKIFQIHPCPKSSPCRAAVVTENSQI